MDTNTAKRKIANCIAASKRSLNPSFQSYWKDTANKLGVKYNVDVKEIEKSPEFYQSVNSASMH